MAPVLGVDRRHRDGAGLADQRAHRHSDDAWNITAAVEIGAARYRRGANEAGKARHRALELRCRARQTDCAKLFHPLLGQEQRDPLATFSPHERAPHAQHQGQTDHGNEQDDARGEDFEQRDARLAVLRACCDQTIPNAHHQPPCRQILSDSRKHRREAGVTRRPPCEAINRRPDRPRRRCQPSSCSEC